MKLWTIDAFTDTPFKGNPAAVCLVDQFPKEQLMQSIAAEINLSETCFVMSLGPSQYHIRWFTPTTEIKLCGHATLATGFLLKTIKKIKGPILTFESLSGPLRVDISTSQISLNFPTDPIKKIPVDTKITEALGPYTALSAATGQQKDSFMVIQYNSFEDLKNLNPNFGKLASVTPHAIIATSPGPKPKIDYALRVFAPQFGINEDPVTGSAQTILSDFWKNQLNKTDFNVLQASQRGGELKVSHLGNRTLISGNAVIVSETMFFSIENL